VPAVSCGPQFLFVEKQMKQFKSPIGSLSVIVALVLPNPCISQTAPAPVGSQQRIQALQEAAAENEKLLHQYQRIETTTLSPSEYGGAYTFDTRKQG